MWSFVICVSLMACQGSLAENFDYQDFSEVDSTDLVKKYGEAYPIQRQDALAGPIPILGLVVIGGLAAGAGAVFQAAEARNNLQTQANTIRTALGTAQTNFNTLTTQISALSSSTTTIASRSSAACAAVSAAGGV
ncbi:uncharacterized protein LOC131878262, partial [Tigriopus californicus]|uniref:uncharacterized protein LOC131878262 n=1 Tax=Tigriopus californicus TaxID=6832 RepID=UPI0027DAA942